MVEYDNARSDLIALTQVTTSHAVYITSNPTAAAQISAKSSTFLKPTSMFRYQAINIFGLQIVSAQTGAEHRRHKNVAKGCFNEEYMEIGWETMVKAFETMVKEEKLEDGGMWKNVKTCMIKVSPALGTYRTLISLGHIAGHWRSRIQYLHPVEYSPHQRPDLYVQTQLSAHPSAVWRSVRCR